MIHDIQKVKNFGIFSDWKPASPLSFKRYNLFYGWNGSGKSTVGKIFRALEKAELPSEFKNAEFSVELENKVFATNSFSISTPTIRVFNQQFVNENIQLDKGTANPIIFLGKENGDLKLEIEAKQKLKHQAKERLDELTKLISDKAKLYDAFLVDSGREFKNMFSQTVFVSKNYDRNDSLRVWEEIKKTGVSLKDYVLLDEVFQASLSFISQGRQMQEKSIEFKELDIESEKELTQSIGYLLDANPTIQAIKRLSNNTDISNWVEQGLTLHKNHESLTCEFCNQPLPEGKLAEIAEHFNKAYIELQESILEKIKQVKKFTIPKLHIETDKLIIEVQEDVRTQLLRLSEHTERINSRLDGYKTALEEKGKNLVNTNIHLDRLGEANFLAYNMTLNSIKSLIEYHNKKVTNFKSEAEQRKGEIEKHIVSSMASNRSVLALEGELKRHEGEKTDKLSLVNTITSLIGEKERELQNENFALTSVNEDLHKFLARKDISLERDAGSGYFLKRGDSIALHLSEGEKTAIGLIYFMVKLKEKDNDISQTIVVFDDPISSFDSNHLFNAFSFIVSNCASAKQLFVLTHNFWFFKLMRDWMQYKPRKALSQFLEVKRGAVCIANNSLLKYHSEYHYVFKKLYDYSLSSELTIDDHFTLANAARRVLESFGAFKKPGASGINGVLEIAKSKDVPENVTTKVYQFLNKYSHLDRIETHENSIENIEQETIMVAKDVLDVIKAIDNDHYLAMISLCEN
ncbi:MAG: AAA family ATPase [Chitinophagales bacterium]